MSFNQEKQLSGLLYELPGHDVRVYDTFCLTLRLYLTVLDFLQTWLSLLVSFSERRREKLLGSLNLRKP